MGKSWANFDFCQKTRESRIFVTPSFSVCRGKRIRTFDPLLPKQVRYPDCAIPRNKKRCLKHRLLVGGEGGIRTPGTPCGIRQFSKLLVSATHPPLRGANCWCKISAFLLTYNLFSDFFSKNRQCLDYQSLASSSKRASWFSVTYNSGGISYS